MRRYKRDSEALLVYLQEMEHRKERPEGEVATEDGGYELLPRGPGTRRGGPGLEARFNGSESYTGVHKDDGEAGDRASTGVEGRRGGGAEARGPRRPK